MNTQKEMSHMIEQEQVDSSLPQETADAVIAIVPGSFTTSYTWLGNGVVPALRFNNGSVNANSRVFVSLSEYSINPTNRGIGSARMNVYNIAPFNGGFFAWVEVDWPGPLNIRFDVFVDP
jgi:hypothetical protein